MERRAAVARPTRTAVVVVLAVVAAVVAFVLWWFQPQKLIIDDTVHEAAPVASTGKLVTIAEGMLRGDEHHTTGTVRLLSLGAGRRVLRLVDLRTSNGPAVHVWLSSATAGASNGAVDDARHVDLGGLKGNIGSQNYAVPATLDAHRFRSVVIWCSRFHVTFGSAPLVAT